MKTPKPWINPSITHNVIVEDNILRIMYTFFLNSGLFDDRMLAVDINELKPLSKRVDHIGHAFLLRHKHEFKSEFKWWVDSDDLATFMFDDKSASLFKLNINNKDQSCHRSAHDERSSEPLVTVLGTRYKVLHGLDRVKLPKDVRKSFYTKASNRLYKFVAELNDPKNAHIHNIQHLPMDGQKATASIWLNYIFSKDGKDAYLWSKNLREIRNLFWKLKINKNDEIVKMLLDLATTADVMTS